MCVSLLLCVAYSTATETNLISREFHISQMLRVRYLVNDVVKAPPITSYVHVHG